MLTYELLDDPNQHVRMDPKGKNKIVDFDFQNGTYITKQNEYLHARNNTKRIKFMHVFM